MTRRLASGELGETDDRALERLESMLFLELKHEADANER